MRFRIITAVLALVLVGGALVAAETLIRRPVSFQVIAQTEVVEGLIAPVAPDQPLIFEIASAQVCDGADFSAPETETPGPCVGFARVRKMVAGEVKIQGAVEGRVLRRGKGDLIVELMAVEDAEPTNICDEGIAALLQVRPASPGEEPRPLCSPTRIAVPATLTEMPRLTLRGHNGRIGHVISEIATIATPSMVEGSLVMRSSSLLRDLGRFLLGQDIGPSRFTINVGERPLNFGEAFSACHEPDRCGPEADEPAPFTAVIGAHESGGLMVHAHIVATAGIVDSYGRRGEIVRPGWFARLIDDPYVGWLYMIAAFLVGLVLKVDRWIFAPQSTETGGS